MTLRENIGLD